MPSNNIFRYYKELVGLWAMRSDMILPSATTSDQSNLALEVKSLTLVA
jgi:hypothetical protein